MLARLGLPAPRLATKLYCAAALFLAAVCGLALAATQFAGQVDEAAVRMRRDGLAAVALAARLQGMLEQQRRLVAVAAASAANAQDEATNRDLDAAIAALIDGIAPARADGLSGRYAHLMSQGGAVFDLARDGKVEQARAAAARHAAAADALALEVQAEGDRRLRVLEVGLDGVAGGARSLIAWMGGTVALIGLAAGPLGLLFLRRLLMRLQGIGAALIRLARNDTSVDIPGIDEQDEFGQLARSVSVFKAKSIELLNKKADFERLNLQLDAAINHMPLGLSMFDGNERLLVCNRRYADMYELPGELTRPGTVHCALWEHRIRKGARHSETRGAAIGTGNYSGSMLIEFSGGRTIAVSRQPLRGGGWLALHEDITERRRQEEKITRLARHDPLTGLANRALFREQLEQGPQRLVRDQGFAVLCLDLDHFKAVNDTLGHPIGDSLLKEVSQRLLGCVRHGDLVARLGGDEFAVIQACARDPGSTEALAARIVETVSRPYTIEGHRIEIATSVGIALAPRDGLDADLLMKNADLALYRAKAAGRRGYSFFMREMSEEIETRRTLETDLRQALHDEELEVLYQPLFCLATERVVGAEAIVRWQHPKQGLIPAAALGALAEEAGLTAEIGDFAMQRACAEAARWPAPVKVAVNVPALPFGKGSIMEGVLQALARSGLPPRRLELEIPEAVLLPENQAALAVLHQLRQLGVRIALDEFGNGYCSLANLRSFPFDTIKISSALIADSDRLDGSRAIVEAVVSLAASLDITTVAEGIEHREQLGRLRGWRCTQAQGYILSPPLPAAEIGRLLVHSAAPAQSTPADVSRESAGSGAPPGSWRAA